MNNKFPERENPSYFLAQCLIHNLINICSFVLLNDSGFMKNVGEYYNRAHFLFINSSYSCKDQSREFLNKITAKVNHKLAWTFLWVFVSIVPITISADSWCLITSLLIILNRKKLIIPYLRKAKYCLEREYIVKMGKEKTYTIETSLQLPSLFYNMHW